MVTSIRRIETIRGNGIKLPAECEIRNIKDIRKSVVAVKRIPKGTKITKKMLEIKRPGSGILPKDINKIIGKMTTKTIKYDEPIQWGFLSKSGVF